MFSQPLNIEEKDKFQNILLDRIARGSAYATIGGFSGLITGILSPVLIPGAIIGYAVSRSQPN